MTSNIKELIVSLREALENTLKSAATHRARALDLKYSRMDSGPIPTDKEWYATEDKARAALDALEAYQSQGVDEAALEKAARALCKSSPLILDGFEGLRGYVESMRAERREEALKIARNTITAYLAALTDPATEGKKE